MLDKITSKANGSAADVFPDDFDFGADFKGSDNELQRVVDDLKSVDVKATAIGKRILPSKLSGYACAFSFTSVDLQDHSKPRATVHLTRTMAKDLATRLGQFILSL